MDEARSDDRLTDSEFRRRPYYTIYEEPNSGGCTLLVCIAVAALAIVLAFANWSPL